MELIDLISLYDENKVLYLKDSNNNILDMYDGRNSIGEQYNNCHVIKFYPFSKYEIIVEIKAD